MVIVLAVAFRFTQQGQQPKPLQSKGSHEAGLLESTGDHSLCLAIFIQCAQAQSSPQLTEGWLP